MESRSRRVRETSELVGACKRMMTAIGLRAEDEDPELIGDLVGLREYLDTVIKLSVVAQRKRGATAQSIAEVLGVTRQAVIMRFPVERVQP